MVASATPFTHQPKSVSIISILQRIILSFTKIPHRLDLVPALIFITITLMKTISFSPSLSDSSSNNILHSPPITYNSLQNSLSVDSKVAMAYRFYSVSKRAAIVPVRSLCSMWATSSTVFESMCFCLKQFVVYNKVRAYAMEGFTDSRKTALIIKGGPGTGKSVIAINLMSDLLRQDINTHYATGSKAFTETLRKVIGSRGSSQFKYFNSYTQANSNEIDVLICDEARETSNSRFTPKVSRATSHRSLNYLMLQK